MNGGCIGHIMGEVLSLDAMGTDEKQREVLWQPHGFSLTKGDGSA